MDAYDPQNQWGNAPRYGGARQQTRYQAYPAQPPKRKAPPSRRARRARGRNNGLLMLMLALAFVSVVGYSGMRIVQRLVAPTHPVLASNPAQTTNPIQTENQQPGTTAWIQPPSNIAVTEIQAYADATSVAPGGILTFYVSTRTSQAPYTMTIYRLGWYDGSGAREMFTRSGTGMAQGYYDELTQTLANCPTCTMDPTTHLVQAHWRPSLRLKIPTDWVTGVYLTELRDTGSGKVAMLYFVVRGNSSAPYLVMTPDTTTEAYNVWGGYSLYLGSNINAADSTSSEEGASPTFNIATSDKATAVSFDRPLVPFGGFGWQMREKMPYDQGLPTFIDALRWFEKSGYDISYMSDVDIDEHPAWAQPHHVLISVGHDEYWSQSMRTTFMTARTAGHSLLFLGANTAYWKITFSPNATGVADRIITCMKSGNETNEFRTLNQPENGMIGVMYQSNTHSGQGFPWVLADVKSPLLDGTGLVPGTAYGCDLVGYEWDAVYRNGATPSRLVVLANSPVTDSDGVHGVSNSTYYYPPSGALVFASGSISWAHALDAFRLFPLDNAQTCNPQTEVVPGIQRLMTNVMAAALSAK